MIRTAVRMATAAGTTRFVEITTGVDRTTFVETATDGGSQLIRGQRLRWG